MMETRETKCDPDTSLDPLRAFYHYHPSELSSRVESWVHLYVVALVLPIWTCSEGGVWGSTVQDPDSKSMVYQRALTLSAMLSM